MIKLTEEAEQAGHTALNLALVRALEDPKGVKFIEETFNAVLDKLIEQKKAAEEFVIIRKEGTLKLSRIPIVTIRKET